MSLWQSLTFLKFSASIINNRDDKMSDESTINQIVDALEGKGGPGNGEYYSDVLRNASPEDRARAQECLDKSEGSNR